MPLLHIHNNLKTLDPQKGKADFEKWLKEKN
jgi:hypothetical protein